MVDLLEIPSRSPSRSTHHRESTFVSLFGLSMLAGDLNLLPSSILLTCKVEIMESQPLSTHEMSLKF